MAFLDESGLSYLWNKLKTMLNSKANNSGVANEFENINRFWNKTEFYGVTCIYRGDRDTPFSNKEIVNYGEVKSLIAESAGGGVSEELQEEIDGKVSKAGDTMTGNLIMSTNSHITMRPTYGTHFTEYRTSGIFFHEANDNGSAWFVIRHSEDEGKRLAFVKGENQNSNNFEPICVGDAINDDNAVTRRQLNAIKPSTVTVTLSSSGWSNNTQTVTVTGVSATETAQVIQPIPAIASQAAYIEAGIYASGQAANEVTFTCTTVPTSNLTVYVLIQTL